MSILYTYGTGSSTESKRWSGVDDLLVQIPNNSSNLVRAKDVRDAVFTLWERVEETSIVAASAASASTTYMNSNITQISVGEISAGVSFSTPQTIQQMFDQLLYPYVGPTIGLNLLSNREYGSPTSVTLNWSVVKKSNTIQTITVGGFVQAPTGNSQVGSQITNGTHSLTPGLSTVNTFIMSVYDGSTTVNTSTSLTWMNKMYWGKVNLSSLFVPNPNLTTSPGDAGLVTAFINSSTINGLNGAGVSPGQILTTTKSRTMNGINGAGDYLIFAWPSSVSGAYSPIFTVNGLQNTAFTKVKTNWIFTNAFGFTASYEVWVSNTQQNSPLNVTIS